MRVLTPTLPIRRTPARTSSPVPTTSPTPSPTIPAPAPVTGLVVHASEYDVAETAERVAQTLRQAGMVTTTVDHAANAASVGQQLRPTTLVIGGAPVAGTPLLLAAQEVGVDLPQKFLAWEDEGGNVYLGYNSADYVAARAGIDLDSEALVPLRRASQTVAAEASGTSAPLGDATQQVSGTDYLVQQTSTLSVAEAIERYEQAFASKDLLLVATVDHAAGAETVGADLRPTTVTFTGTTDERAPVA